MKSQAIVVKEVNGTWDCDDVEIGDPEANEVLVAIQASGACHSDLSLHNGTIPYEFPAVFGHEGAGTVVKVGSGVKRVKAGDKVCLSWAFCRNCDTCAAGHPAHCDSWPLLNLTGNRASGVPGFANAQGKPVKSSFLGQSSFARHVLCDETSVIPIKVDTDIELLSVLGCGMITGAGAVLNILKPNQGTTIAVFGVGAVGAAAIMAAAISPLAKIIAIDLKDNRLELAKKCGATHTINASSGDVVQMIKDLTGGRGVNYAVEASGVTRVMDQAIKCLAPLGTVASIGIAPLTECVQVNLWEHILSGKRYAPSIHAAHVSHLQVGALEGDCNPQTLVPFLAELHKNGRFPFDLLCKKFKFSQITEAFEAMKDGSVIKPILVWD